MYFFASNALSFEQNRLEEMEAFRTNSNKLKIEAIHPYSRWIAATKCIIGTQLVGMIYYKIY